MSRKEYLQHIISLHERLILTSEEYEGVAEEFIRKQELNIPAMKEQWLEKVEEFKQILTDMMALEIPNAFEIEGKDLQLVYERFVHCVEEKTYIFSVEAMENGELDTIQEQEEQAAERMEELIQSMFDK